MRVVVTGAAGFLGRAVTGVLQERGIACVGLSRRHMPGCLRVSDYAEAMPADVLVHLAEASDRAQANRNGSAGEQASSDLVRKLVGKGYGKIVYASSAVLYGDREMTPRQVDDPVFTPDSYTRIKHEAERQVLDSGGVAARLSNLYGPGMVAGNVLGTMLAQLGREGPVRLQSTTPVRDFLWGGDAAEAIVLMAMGDAAGVMNVGSGTGTSIAALADAVLAAAGEAVRPVISLQSDTPPSHLVLDISATTKAIGWRPAVGLQDGVRCLLKSQSTTESHA